MTVKVNELKFKIGDIVTWSQPGSTKMSGELVGLCRSGVFGAGNSLLWLVQFIGRNSFDEPFAIPEEELRIRSPLELLASANDDE
jgi:hypothetical protein